MWAPFLPSQSHARAQFLCLSGAQLRDWWTARKWGEGRKRCKQEEGDSPSHWAHFLFSSSLCVYMMVSWPVWGRECSSSLYFPPTLSSWPSSVPITFAVDRSLGLSAFSHRALIGYKLKMPLTERLLICAVFSSANRQRGGISQLSSPGPLSALTPFLLLIYGT